MRCKSIKHAVYYSKRTSRISGSTRTQDHRQGDMGYGRHNKKQGRKDRFTQEGIQAFGTLGDVR